MTKDDIEDDAPLSIPRELNKDDMDGASPHTPVVIPVVSPIKPASNTTNTSPPISSSPTLPSNTTSPTSSPPLRDQTNEGNEEEDYYTHPMDMLHGDLSGMDEAMRNCLRNAEISYSSEDDSTISASGTLKRSTVINPENPVLDDFVLNALLAIRTSVLDAYNQPRKPYVSDEDFPASRKYKLSMAGDKKTEVKDFAPLVFQKIRNLFGISTKSYLMSWSDSNIAKSKSAGKSSSHFVHSPDRKFIIKTLSSEEAKRLRKLLVTYYLHLESHPDTMLSRIFGLHRLKKWRGQGKVYFAVFNNVFDTPHPVKTVFDLKGSSVGRRASEQSSVLKDLDLKDRKLRVAKDVKQKLLYQIEQDCKFLESNDLMDYSLLVGIRRTDKKVSVTEKKTKLFPTASTDKKVPGLLFFIESYKIMRAPKDANQKKSVKTNRRKSLTTTPPSFKTPIELTRDEEEEEAEATKELQNGTTPVDTTEPNSGSSEDTLDNESAQENGNDVEMNHRLQINSSYPNLPSVSAEVSSNMTPSASVPNISPAHHMDELADADYEGYEEELCDYVPFFQKEEGGMQSVTLEEKEEKEKEKEEGAPTQFYEIYYVGVIDFLQRYNKKKKIANFAKSLKHNKEDLSTVDPTFYMNRFLKMVDKIMGE